MQLLVHQLLKKSVYPTKYQLGLGASSHLAFSYFSLSNEQLTVFTADQRCNLNTGFNFL